MSQDPNRNGGGYPNQPGGRQGNALSKSDKTANSPAFDEHLADEEILGRHGLKQKAHMDAVQRRKDGERVDPNTVKVADDESKPVLLESEEDDVKVVLSGEEQVPIPEDQAPQKTLNQAGRLIVGLRVYDRNPDGTPSGRRATSDELLAKHREIRKERAEYIDQDGTHVRVGELTRDRKGKYLDEPTYWGPPRTKERRVPAVMRSILGRLMPHEGEVSGEELTQEMVEEAMDEAVSEFQKATGCEIISAAAHRMSGHDLHIHIQYTMVVRQEKRLGKYTKERKEWREMASTMAREELHREGVDDPNPSAVGARKKRLVKAGKLDPEPEFKVVIRKVKGLRSMGAGAILGHSFRNKVNLVRLAEEAELPDLAQRVIDRKDEPGGFRPIAECPDGELEGEYLDLWLERAWRRIVKAKLSKEGLQKVRSAGVVAVKNYANFGAVMPKKSDLERTRDELLYKEAELGWESQILEMEAAEHLQEIEQSFRERVYAVLKRLLGMRQKFNLRRKELRERESKLDQREVDVAAREAAVNGREIAVKVDAPTQEELNQLRVKASLGEKLLAFIKQILDTPGVGLLLRKRTEIWNRMQELAPEMGLEAKVGAIDAVRETKKRDRTIDQKEQDTPPL